MIAPISHSRDLQSRYANAVNTFQLVAVVIGTGSGTLHGKSTYKLMLGLVYDVFGRNLLRTYISYAISHVD